MKTNKRRLSRSQCLKEKLALLEPGLIHLLFYRLEVPLTLVSAIIIICVGISLITFPGKWRLPPIITIALYMMAFGIFLGAVISTVLARTSVIEHWQLKTLKRKLQNRKGQCQQIATEAEEAIQAEVILKNVIRCRNELSERALRHEIRHTVVCRELHGDSLLSEVKSNGDKLSVTFFHFEESKALAEVLALSLKWELEEQHLTFPWVVKTVEIGMEKEPK